MCDLLLVVGSQNSSNSRRLVEVCEKDGVPSHLVDDRGEVEAEWLANVEHGGGDRGGIGAGDPGAGTDSHRCSAIGFGELEEMELKEEDVRFQLPVIGAEECANCRA